MKVAQHRIIAPNDFGQIDIPFQPNIFFLFVSPLFENLEQLLHNIHAQYPNAMVIGCSTAGEIMGNQVFDSSTVLTAVKFEETSIKITAVDLEALHLESYQAGAQISQSLHQDDLRHIFVLSDGLHVNGAELVKGLHSRIAADVSITGGLAGDGSNFQHTFVIHNQEIAAKKIVAIGLYGNALKIGFGSKGGWDSFGIERLVTKSENNVLYELDGQPALELYKSFLGDKAKELPSSGLLFPLSMRDEDNITSVVRTILAVNEEEQSLTFAGNIPQGAYVRLMKANVDRLIMGAEQSALICKDSISDSSQLAFLISCVGRRLVMKQLVEEEIEAVNDVLGTNVYTTGFYSYGEIAPFNKYTPCALHNQTMTITTLSE